MKRTCARDPANTFATIVATTLWLLYYFITLVLPVIFAIWFGLSMVDAVVNFDCFMEGIPYELHEFNIFIVLDRLFKR
jgi:hypothetical protein